MSSATTTESVNVFDLEKSISLVTGNYCTANVQKQINAQTIHARKECSANFSLWFTFINHMKHEFVCLGRN